MPVQPRIAPLQAQSVIIDLIQFLEPIPLLAGDYLSAIDRVSSLNFPGGGIFDALIAQAALKAAVEVILTINPRHFIRLGEPITSLVQVPK